MNQFYRKLILVSVIFPVFACIHAKAQKNSSEVLVSKFLIGVEVQWYPAGWLIGPAANYFVAPKHVINVRACINIADRHDWSGLNDDEKGTGYGGSIGYRFLFTPKKSSFFLGARSDLFDSRINWKNKIGTPQQTSGSTRILVLQPSAEAGYWIKFKNQKWDLLFAGGVGQEINIKTRGKEVGQGGMWLLGVSFYYRP